MHFCPLKERRKPHLVRSEEHQEALALVLRKKMMIIMKMTEIVRSSRKPWSWCYNADDDEEGNDNGE